MRLWNEKKRWRVRSGVTPTQPSQAKPNRTHSALFLCPLPRSHPIPSRVRRRRRPSSPSAPGFPTDDLAALLPHQRRPHPLPFPLFPWPPRDCGGRSAARHHRLVVKAGSSSTRTAGFGLATTDPRRARSLLFRGLFVPSSPPRAAGRGTLLPCPRRRCPRSRAAGGRVSGRAPSRGAAAPTTPRSSSSPPCRSCWTTRDAAPILAITSRTRTFGFCSCTLPCCHSWTI